MIYNYTLNKNCDIYNFIHCVWFPNKRNNLAKLVFEKIMFSPDFLKNFYVAVVQKKSMSIIFKGGNCYCLNIV